MPDPAGEYFDWWQWQQDLVSMLDRYRRENEALRLMRPSGKSGDWLSGPAWQDAGWLRTTV
jgi:hypothetical protein